MKQTTRFCPKCAGPLAVREVEGEQRNHKVCRRCGALHVDSPKIVAKCFVFYGKRLLWARRGIEPRRGLWAIPGGFLESGETLMEGATRELREETGICLEVDQLHFYFIGSVTFVNQIHIAFRATVESDFCQPGIESLECRFFTREESPWDALAYPEAKDAMVQAYHDLDRGTFKPWQADLSLEGYELRPINEN